MIVKLPQTRVVGARNSYNEIVVKGDVSQITGSNRGSSYRCNGGTNEDKLPERIMIQLPSNWSKKVNVGDRVVAGLTGIMTYSSVDSKLIRLAR